MYNGWCFYRGPSLLDGSPIIALVSGIHIPSENSGTGPMAQTWIIREDITPSAAVSNALDFAVCGDCKLRSKICYVMTFHGAGAVWRAYRDGQYLKHPVGYLQREASVRPLRIGSYGDPAAVPYAAWEKLMGYFPSHTGYTHQWRGLGKQFKGVLQASCDSREDYEEASAQGWKCFTVAPEGTRPVGLGRECSKQKYHSTCFDCRLCNGRQTDVWINVHGRKSKVREHTWE